MKAHPSALRSDHASQFEDLPHLRTVRIKHN
jgi:hypothetical protein